MAAELLSPVGGYSVASVSAIVASVSAMVPSSSTSGMTGDRAGYKQLAAQHLRAFADGWCKVDDAIAEGDRVALRFGWGGTHRGEYLGIAPTGKQVTVSGVCIKRMAGGKVVEEWTYVDVMGMMQQLGVAPPPKASRPGK